MEYDNVDLAVIGAGPAGMAAALGAYNEGVKSIVLIERENRAGGILNQCIHNGFGLHRFSEELTGPEYAARDIEAVKKNGINLLVGTTVLRVGEDKTVFCVNENGAFSIKAKVVVFAMGCRERPRGALNTPGGRCSGIFTAGCAQKLMNMGGFSVGSEVVILGSGDIGLIMARRLTLEGAKVKGVFEIMPYSNGLNRNIVQCLNDYDIPLRTSCTIARIHGKKRLEGVTVANVDTKMNIIEGSEEYIPCDTLLLSVGLIPENELTLSAGAELDNATKGAVVNQYRQTQREGFFACGNVLHVHDLVDFVSEEGFTAGKAAARYISGKRFGSQDVKVAAGEGLGYCVPQTLNTSDMDGSVRFYMRVRNVEAKKKISALLNGEEIKTKKELKFVPGEMINIEIPKAKLEGQKGILEFRVNDL